MVMERVQQSVCDMKIGHVQVQYKGHVGAEDVSNVKYTNILQRENPFWIDPAIP